MSLLTNRYLTIIPFLYSRGTGRMIPDGKSLKMIPSEFRYHFLDGKMILGKNNTLREKHSKNDTVRVQVLFLSNQGWNILRSRMLRKHIISISDMVSTAFSDVFQKIAYGVRTYNNFCIFLVPLNFVAALEFATHMSIVNTSSCTSSVTWAWDQSDILIQSWHHDWDQGRFS